MKQTDETKKTAAPADGAEAPEAPKPGETLSDAATDAVSGGGWKPFLPTYMPEGIPIPEPLIAPDFVREISK